MRERNMLRSIKECEVGHCRFHFPQFKRFTEKELVEALNKVLSGQYDDYYKPNYPNWQNLNKEYQKILDMLGKGKKEFIAACDHLMSLENSFIHHHLVIDLQGDVAEFLQCCG
jgi:hypothetical protein